MTIRVKEANTLWTRRKRIRVTGEKGVSAGKEVGE